MIVYLVPIGGDRFELYSEPPDEAAGAHPRDSRFRRWAHKATEQWHALVETARQGTATGRLAQWRDRIVCALAESIAEQRTLWALRGQTDAVLHHPASMAGAPRTVLDGALTKARWHHGFWLAIDLPLVVASALLAPIPGPNAVAYYLAFRVVGHYLSWRGAHQALRRAAWTLQPDAHLDELASLVNAPRDQRAERVHAIAQQLNLHRLFAFFQRVAA
jgi:hypothetical protein